jgi:hypothetical protein
MNAYPCGPNCRNPVLCHYWDIATFRQGRRRKSADMKGYIFSNPLSPIFREHILVREPRLREGGGAVRRPQ